jgi:RNA polymerase sigma factor (sigma-70 family)
MDNTGIRTYEPSADDLAALAHVIQRVARRANLSTDDALDFGQTVHLRLVERGYEALRQFSGRSSLNTFLTVVVGRMLLDWGRSQYGKWHSSAAARRLGPAAVALEVLLFRSGHTLDEAVAIMRSRHDSPAEAELVRLAGQLPPRPCRRPVAVAVLENAAVAQFEDPIEQSDRTRSGRAIRGRLAAAIARLAPEERRLLQLRYQRRLAVPALAQALSVDAKTLYRRCDRALRRLRAALEADGVTWSECLSLLQL